MKWIACVFLMPLVIAGANASAFSLRNLDAAEDLALGDRLAQILERQRMIVLMCASGAIEMHEVNKTFPRWTPRPSESAATDADAIKAETLERLRIVAGNVPRVRDCAEKTRIFRNLFEALSPRSALPSKTIFRTSCLSSSHEAGCLKEMAAMWEGTRPHCFRSLRKGLAGFFEDHACFGGDVAMNEELSRSFGQEKYRFALEIGEAWLVAARNAADGDRLDLREVTGDIVPNVSVRQTFVMAAALGSSGNSGMTGWLQGLEDRWLVESLADGKTAETIYTEVKLLQAAKIRYQAMRDTVEKKKLDLTIGEARLQGWNRHNVMAAFLSCHFSDLKRGNVVSLIGLLGVGYESKDFLSHLLEGVGWQASKRNFQQDTERYRVSGRIGYDLCSKNPVE